MSRDPRIDAYVERAEPFARPLLAHVREQVQAVLPEVEETLKWGMPAFTLQGRIILMIAAFKRHMTISFWRGKELRGTEAKDEAMGQFGRIATAADLPSDEELARLIGEAVELSRSAPAPRQPRAAHRPAAEPHPDFLAALEREPEARAAFDAFPPGSRREYAEWIGEAKREETRAKRIATAIAQLREGKNLHWKYERC